MNCFSCRRPFDDVTFIPRLLIGCGHSLCEHCITKMYITGRVICPDCQTVNTASNVQGYPKNLALINVKHNEKQNDLCSRHGKKYEAFCDKDKQLLCVNCILQDGHRNHPIQSIANAYQKEKDKLAKVLQLTNKVYQNTHDKITKLEQSLRQAACHYQESEVFNDRFFAELRKIITAEEQCLKSKSKDAFVVFEAKCHDRQNRLIQHLQVIDRLTSLINHSEAYDSIELLDSIHAHEELKEQLTTENQQVTVYTGVTLTKTQLCDDVTRQLDKLKSKDVRQNVKVSINHSAKKPAPFSDRMKKLASLKENNLQKPPILHNKACKRQSKDIRKTPPVTEKILAKCQVSAFEHDPSLFKSFLSSNTSFFIEKRCIYVFGGFCEESNSVSRLNLDSKKWQHITTMENRSKFGIANLDQEVLILGGKRDKQRVALGEIFHQGVITPFWGLQSVRSGFGVVVLNEEVIIIGGNDGDYILKTAQKYDRLNSCWQRIDDLNENRDELSATIGRDGRIYAIGGFGSAQNVCLKSVQRYNPTINKWQFMKPMLQPRRALSIVTLADGIYAIGGFDGQNYLNSVEKYDEFSNSWTMICSMIHARCTHYAVAVFETQEIYVFGGFDYSPLSSIERYSVVTDTWEQVGSMPVPRFMHGCAYMKE